MTEWDGRCPDCQRTVFLAGPRGGLSRNMQCTHCKLWINVVEWQGYKFFLERLPDKGKINGKTNANR